MRISYLEQEVRRYQEQVSDTIDHNEIFGEKNCLLEEEVTSLLSKMQQISNEL
jgi:hypothetical protein